MIGSTELLAILIAALFLFGPRKLPELARSLGSAVGEFKKAQRAAELELTTFDSYTGKQDMKLLPGQKRKKRKRKIQALRSGQAAALKIPWKPDLPFQKKKISRLPTPAEKPRKTKVCSTGSKFQLLSGNVSINGWN